jgi:hypothetical protein
MAIDKSEIDEAVIISMSKPPNGYPLIANHRLEDKHGKERGAQLNDEVGALLREIMKIDVDWKSMSLFEGGDYAGRTTTASRSTSPRR